MTAMGIAEIQPRAQAALLSSPLYELRELHVQHDDNTLQICGCVSSYYHKQLAQEVIRSVCSGIQVVNLINVYREDDVA